MLDNAIEYTEGEPEIRKEMNIDPFLPANVSSSTIFQRIFLRIVEPDGQ